MPKFNNSYIDYQLKRFMRPDAHRYLRPDWRRHWKLGSENDPLYRYYDSLDRKYRPDQPRVPAGSREGGQWTEDGTSSASTNSSNSDSDFQDILQKAKQIAAAGRTTYQKCLDVCYPLLERFQRPGSDRNQWDFLKCLNVCLGK